MVEQGVNNGVFKNQVGFKEQRIVLKQVFLGQVQGIDIVGAGIQGIVHVFHRGGNVQPGKEGFEFFPFITRNDYNFSRDGERRSNCFIMRSISVTPLT